MNKEQYKFFENHGYLVLGKTLYGQWKGIVGGESVGGPIYSCRGARPWVCQVRGVCWGWCYYLI